MPKPDAQPQDDETPKEDATTQILAKLDVFEKRITALEPKPNATPPEKSAEVIAAESAFREILSDMLPKEKLGAYSLSQLIVAADVKKHYKPAKVLPDPPSGKGDTKPEEQKPLGFYAKQHGVKT
jgi:hypothetical protein